MQDDFGVVLALAYQGLVEQLHAELARHGFRDVRSSYGYVLRTLVETPLSQRELAHRLGVTDQAIAKLVAELVRRKLVRRLADPADGRVRRLVVGPRGAELLRHARRFHARFERDLVSRLGPDVAATRRVLAHIIADGPSDPGRARLRLV